jgi:hypothetical protein
VRHHLILVQVIIVYLFISFNNPVKTGKYRNGDELRDGGVDSLFENFGKGVDSILEQLKK